MADSLALHRIRTFLDKDSFESLSLPGNLEGGFGRVSGRPVAVYANDPSVMGGSMGTRECRKLVNLLKSVQKRMCPVVGFLHSGGARIQEGVESLAGYAQIFYLNTKLSGLTPQISVILGPCAGGAVYSPGLTDFVIMAKGRGEMYITGPDVIRQTTGEITDRESLGGADVHSRQSGVAHRDEPSEEDAISSARYLLEYLPSSSKESVPVIEPVHPNPDQCYAIEEIAQGDSRKAYDTRVIVEAVLDQSRFYEVQPDYAQNIRVGFGRLDGRSVGIVANNPAHLAGALDIEASSKAARFVRLCDAYNIPLVTFVDVPGYWPGIEQEHRGIIRHGSKLLYAYAEAHVPRVSVCLRKAYGGAYCVMGSKQLGACSYFAWPGAELAVMGPRGAVEILYKREIAASKDPHKFKEKKIEAYRKEFVNPKIAFGKGYVDEIIEPSQTREKIIQALKKALSGWKISDWRHGNIPL